MQDRADELHFRLTVIERLLAVVLAELSEQTEAGGVAYLEAIRAGAEDTLAEGIERANPQERAALDCMLDEVDAILDLALAMQRARPRRRRDSRG